MTGVEKWMKRHSKKTFYLLKKEIIVPGRHEHYLIWNDKDKTKYGAIRDGAFVRYGIQTTAVLSGETEFDVWSYDSLRRINHTVFKAMLLVRHGHSKLPIFDLSKLKELQY
jgi:hypothetical protein